MTALTLSIISGMTNERNKGYDSSHQVLSEEYNGAIAREWVDLGLASGTLWASMPEKEFYKWDDAMRIFGVNIPTVWQWKELIDSCSWEDADNGWLAIGKNGNSIFIPVTGASSFNGKMVYSCYGDGFYWSSRKISKKKAYGARFLNGVGAEHITTMMLRLEDSGTIQAASIDRWMLRVWLVNK